MANEFKIRNGLQINESQIISSITDNSGLTADSSTLATANAVKGYADNADASLSTAISGEVITRGSADTSLSTAISGEVITRGSADTSLSTAISGEVVTRGSADTSLSTAVSLRVSVDTSLSTAISSEIVTRGSADTSLSTAISSEIVTRGSADTSLSTAVSQRVSVDTSLSTAISGEVVTRGSADTSLSTAISSEIVTRGSADTSLSTALNGKLSISGGTVMSTFYLNGLTSSAVAADVLYYDIATSGITHGAKPTGGGVTGYQTTGSTVFTYIGGTGTTIDSYANTEDFAVYFYTIMSGTTEKRAGIITINNTTTLANMNESTTIDIGNTSVVSFAVDISGGNVRLNAIIASGSGTWTCKFIKNQI